MKLTDLQKYKHDTIGKFQTLKTLIESLNEENLKTDESLEILVAADETYAKMIESSRQMLEKRKS